MLRNRTYVSIPLALLQAAAVGPTAATPSDSTLSHSAPAAEASRPASPSSELLADGSRVDRWTLANGLRVVTRHLPGAHSAAVTLCYRLGSREDPLDQEGRAELVAYTAFTGRCGDVPERSIMELDQLRPVGWSLQVGPHLTELTEACPTALLPGVLHQMCQRLRGIALNDALVERCRQDARRQLRQNYDTQPEKTLYFLSGEMAAGRSAERAQRYGTGKGLDGVGLGELSAALNERLVPANSVLSVVGDLSGLDTRVLIERDLGHVRAGKPGPPVRWGEVGPSAAALVRPDLRQRLGLVVVIAPALTDSLHPYFTAFTVSAATALRRAWGKPDAPLTSRYQFSIAIDPELVRFYPPVRQGGDEAEHVFQTALTEYANSIVDSTSIATAAENMLWLTGGAMPADLFQRARTDPAVIHTLATTHAALEAFEDAAFWATYRARLQRAKSLDLGPFMRWYGSPKARVTLLLSPQEH